MQPNLLRNLCFLPTKNTKYRTFLSNTFFIDIDHVSIAIHIVIVLSPSPTSRALPLVTVHNRGGNRPLPVMRLSVTATVTTTTCGSRRIIQVVRPPPHPTIGLVLKKLFRCIPNFDTILKYLTWFHYSFSTVSTDCKDITGQSHPLIKINNINGSLITASKKSGCQKNVVIFRIHQLNLGRFFFFITDLSFLQMKFRLKSNLKSCFLML